MMLPDGTGLLSREEERERERERQREKGAPFTKRRGLLPNTNMYMPPVWIKGFES